MRHDLGSKTFKAYQNQRVQFDVQAALLERPSADGLLKGFAHMSLTYDPRAPTTVPADYLNKMPPHPHILYPERQHETLKTQLLKSYTRIKNAEAGEQVEYKRILNALDAAKTKRRKKAKSQYRKEYFDKRHTEEIERQLSGGGFHEYVEPVIQHQLSERMQLQKILCSFPKQATPQDVLSRRLEAVRLMTALCHRREVQRPKQRLNHVSPPQPPPPGRDQAGPSRPDSTRLRQDAMPDLHQRRALTSCATLPLSSGQDDGPCGKTS